MKKAILSTLSSAFVIPGLGQVINQDLKKGGCILSAVFVLFLTGVITIYLRVNSILKTEESTSTDFAVIVDTLRKADFSPLWYLLAAFVSIWLYSVVDAFLKGRKLDQLRERNPL
jgi:hypothetical protein